MEPITSDTILILAGSFLCVFLSLVTVGGLFLYWRTKQQKNNDSPAPQPPPVTRDVHAAPLAEMPTRQDAEDEPPRPPPPKPATNPLKPSPPPFETPSEQTTSDETLTRSRPALRPLGIEPEDDFDEGGETTTRNIPVGEGFDTLILPSPNENDTTPTVIIDRNKPMIDDDDEV